MASDHKYIIENPMENVLRPINRGKKPNVFSPQECSDLLWVCRQTDKKFLPYLVIGMFAGVRPEELEKLKWRHFDMATPSINIDSTVAKMSQNRVVEHDEFEGILLAWLRECKPEGEYIFPTEPGVERNPKGVRQCIRRHREALAERAGVRWTQDQLRKTAASYMMQKNRNENIVAKVLGNSPEISERHYVGVVPREDGEVFWPLTPANVPNVPIQLPKGGKGSKNGPASSSTASTSLPSRCRHPADGHIHLRVTFARESACMRTARQGKLTEWYLWHLVEAAVYKSKD